MTTDPTSSTGYELRLTYEPLADLLSARIEEADAYLVPFEDHLVLHLDRRDLGSLVGFHINEFDSYDLSLNRGAIVEILGEEILEAIDAISAAVKERLSAVSQPTRFSEEAVRQYEREASVARSVQLRSTDPFGLLRGAPERSRRLQAVRAFVEDLGADLDLAPSPTGVIRIPLGEIGRELVAAVRERAQDIRETAQELALTLFAVRPQPVVGYGDPALSHLQQAPTSRFAHRYALTESETDTEPVVLELSVESRTLYFEGQLADLPSGTPVTVQVRLTGEGTELLRASLGREAGSQSFESSVNLNEDGFFIIEVGQLTGDPPPLDRVIEWFELTVGTQPHPADIPPTLGLTLREQQVLELVASGYTNKESAEHLGISVKTLEKHVSSIMRKLGVVERQELIDLAGEMGLISRTDPN